MKPTNLYTVVKRFLENPEIRIVVTSSEEVIQLRDSVDSLQRENEKLKHDYDLLERKYFLECDKNLSLTDEIYDLKRRK